MSSGRGGIPNEVVEEIISRNDIVSVVGQYVQFTKSSGQNQFGLCPFHSEDTPSFSVSVNKQIYYCFGCHKGGNVVNFIMDVEHLTYVEALKFLAEKSGVTIPESNDVNYRREEEFRKRVKAVLRRTKADTKVFEFDDIRIEFNNRRVFKAGVEVELKPKEFDLLEALINNRNLALSREKLLRLVWDYDYEGDSRTVDVHVQRIRQKLGISDRIQTVYKTGYRFEI